MNTRTTRRRTALLLCTVLLSAAGAPAAAAGIAPPGEAAPLGDAVAPDAAPDAAPIIAPPSDAWRGMTWRVLSREGGVVGVGVDDLSDP